MNKKFINNFIKTLTNRSVCLNITHFQSPEKRHIFAVNSMWSHPSTKGLIIYPFYSNVNSNTEQW